MSKLSKRHFWEWFRRHNQEFITLNNKTKKEANYWLNELNAHVRAYYKFFEFSMDLHKEKPCTLTITVGGKAAHFKKVDALVALAPEIPGWIFATLENPRPIDFCMDQLMDETGIDPRELYFSIDNDSNHAWITVYHPLCTHENEHLIQHLGRAAAFNLLGERSFGNDIGDVSAMNLSYAIEDRIHPLEELLEVIGQRKSAMVIDGEGNLVM